MKFCRNIIMIFALFLPQSAHAWSSNIHRSVCEIVWQQLDATERKQLLKITQDHDIQNFSTGCAWPDWVRKKSAYKHTATWHYQNDDQQESHADCTAGCLIKAIKENYKILQTGKGRERSDALYFLAHLIADLHQPLHTGRGADRGGNTLKVRFGKKKTNLHKVWDSRMLARKRSNIILEIQKFAEPFSEEIIWPESLDDWYAESHHIAMTRIYPAYENSTKIDAAYLAEFRPLSYQLLNRAAMRTTLLLQHFLREQTE